MNRSIGQLGILAARCALGLTCVVAAASAQVTPFVPTRTMRSSRQALQQKLAGGASAVSGPCAIDADCNDGNACTADVCDNERCVNTPTLGCVPCDPGIRQALADLTQLGVTVTPHYLGIANSGDVSFPCLTGDVVSKLGPDVPGDLLTCAFPDGTSPFESWGPATAIVAHRFPWIDGALRIVVPIGDEGPCNGSRPDGCNDPGDDRDSIDNAIAVSLAAGVIASPIVGSGSNTCTIDLATLLADRTGGEVILVENARADIPGAVVEMILNACDGAETCPPVEVVFVMDTSGSMRDEALTICGKEACNDFNLCTDQDMCVDGVCSGSPNFDTAQACCDPSDATTEAIDDGNACTNDVCDALTGLVDHPPVANGTACEDGLFCTRSDSCVDGACVGGPARDCGFLDEGCFVGACDETADTCAQVPVEQGAPCDDDALCTAEDVCDGQGACAGTDINTIPCASDDECYIAVCDTDTGMCDCGDVPDLCLTARPSTLPNAECYTVGEEITVDVELGFSTQWVSGGDLFLGYDPAVLTLVGIVPGQSADPESPFSLELFRMVDESAGEIMYSVGTKIGAPPTHGPAIMASLRFEAVGSCGSDAPCWLDRHPMHTTLTDYGGDPLAFTPCCETNIVVNGAAPAMICPNSLSVNADPGTTRATVTWAPATGDSECDGPTSVTCTATNSFGANIDHLIPSGGVFPSGLSSFECAASDGCGVRSTCDWTVNVSTFNAVEVNLELSPVMNTNPAMQPLQRCIEFEFFSSCVQQPVVVQQTVDFGLPFDLPGHADDVAVQVPAGDYACVTARDPKHTLRSVSDLEIVGHTYRASFKGDPFFGGNWLTGGNLDGSNVIDVVDYGLFLDRFITFQDSNTPCGTPGVNADFNGDGLVDQLDWSFISINFLEYDKDACCPRTTAATDESPITEISLDELRDMGLGDLNRADLNGDGVLNSADIDAFIRDGALAKTTLRSRSDLRRSSSPNR